MKIKIIIAVLFFSVNVVYISAFGGDKDSLLLDGGPGIKTIQSYTGKCDVKVLRVSGKNSGVKSVAQVEMGCGEIGTDTFYTSEKGQLKKDDILSYGEEVSTGDDGIIELEMWDGAVLRMAPNTTIKITSDFCDSRSIFQKQGSIWYKIKKFIGGGKFEVVSDNRTAIGVRGTEFTVETREDKTILRVYEGSVDIRPIGKGLHEGIEKTGNEMQKLTEDFQNGKITIEEFNTKAMEFSKILQEKTDGIIKSTVVDAGNMVTVIDMLGNIEPIPASDVKWFEDSNFNK
jgi:hypothetical protein